MFKQEHITITFHLPMEFLYSLFALGTGNHFYKMITDFNLTPNEEITDFIEQLKKDLSKFMESELIYFFDLPGIGYIFYQYILLHDEITDIPKLINAFEEYTPVDFCFRLVESVCKTNMPAANSQEYNRLQTDISRMISVVEETEFQDKLRQERVLECLKNPEETKLRLCFLLDRFYRNHFRRIETSLTKMGSLRAETYASLYVKNPHQFLEQYLNATSSLNSSSTVCISFFKYIAWHHYSLNSSENSSWFILGMFSNLLFDENVSLERFSNAFKSLSDTNRIAILKLLAEKSWYGQEIAEKLNITPATVSYHMAFLQKAGFISFQRMDNRFYYCLNKTNLIKYVEDFIRFIE